MHTNVFKLKNKGKVQIKAKYKEVMDGKHKNEKILESPFEVILIAEFIVPKTIYQNGCQKCQKSHRY